MYVIEVLLSSYYISVVESFEAVTSLYACPATPSEWESNFYYCTITNNCCRVDEYIHSITITLWLATHSLNSYDSYIPIVYLHTDECRNPCSMSCMIPIRTVLLGDSEVVLTSGDYHWVLPQIDAAISLPPSLIEFIDDRVNVGVLFAVYNLSNIDLFSRQGS